MTARVHGGPDAHGVARHDFSSNANACGPCPDALAAVRAADLARYPDPSFGALREQLAAFHGVDARRVVVAASGSEFIFRITAWARGGGCVSVPAHGYGDYAAAARAFGLALAPRGALTWLCEPSNPLGCSDEREPGGTTVLDLAYEPLRLEGVPRERECLWQLWTPNKALGLTGVRGAYAIAPSADEAALLDAFAPSWPLGADGVAMLHAWREGAVQQWLAASRDVLRGWKARQQALCRELGFDVLAGSQANFFTVHAPRLAAALPALRDHGIQLRDCASFGLPGHVRLAVLAPAAQDALAATSRTFA